jgi:pimeloyl-ACP methyl ester carboxylesterase
MQLQLETLRLSNRLLGRVAPDSTAERARRLFFKPRRLPVRSPPPGARREQFGQWSALRFTPPAPVGRALLLHGWESGARHLSGLAARLCAQGAEVIALDAPAHGESPGEEAHPIAFAQALLEVGRALGPVDLVVGHSMGGGATLLALAEGLEARAAVLLASPADLEAVLRRFARFVALPGRATEQFIRSVEKRTGRPVAAASPDLLAPRIAQPVLVVHDRGDLEIPFSDGEALAARLPRARLLATEGLGHRKILRDAAVHEAVAAAFAETVAAR